MLIGSSGGAGCCVILEHAVLSRVLKADALDMSVCVVRFGWGGFQVRCRVVRKRVSPALVCAVLGCTLMIPVMAVKCEYV